MEQEFQIHLPLINRNFQVRKSSFDLTILREALFSVTIDNLPLIEYYVLFDHSVKTEQIKAKVYKTAADGKWYDKSYSEEAALNSPEFGIPEINSEIKKAIDVYESMHAGIETCF
ncbi:MAG TPA: hypothetical protein VET23_04315 [Chitinophagaceae bacterium]|nr:hypothetical protein [Chitinophagaceae bacterium]